MVKRRGMLLGLGALATGSGAVFSSATFNNSVSPSSDMRVVVEEDLIVEPGILFRNGSDADDTFDPGGATPPGNETLFSDGGVFDGTSVDSSLTVPDDLPAASANDAVNDNLSLEVATSIGTTDQIGTTSAGFIQIRNDTTENRDVAIRFDEFGADTTGDQDSNSGQVSESDVISIYEFYDTSDNKISTDSVGSVPSDQTVANFVTVPSGTVEQVYLSFDTTVAESDIRNAVNSTSSPFGGGQDTVDLVDTLGVGTDDGV